MDGIRPSEGRRSNTLCGRYRDHLSDWQRDRRLHHGRYRPSALSVSENSYYRPPVEQPRVR